MLFFFIQQGFYLIHTCVLLLIMIINRMSPVKVPVAFTGRGVRLWRPQVSRCDIKQPSDPFNNDLPGSHFRIHWIFPVFRWAFDFKYKYISICVKVSYWEENCKLLYSREINLLQNNVASAVFSPFFMGKQFFHNTIVVTSLEMSVTLNYKYKSWGTGNSGVWISCAMVFVKN